MESFQLLQFDDVRIVPFASKHLTERYIAWLNDPIVVRFSEQRHFRHTRLTCMQYFESMQNKSSHLFLAVEVDKGILGHIGNIGVTIDYHNLIADMSIIIGEKHAWGKGFASKAWNAVLCYLLENKKLRKITAGTMSENTSMLRLMLRSGMQIESIRPKHFLLDGKEIDLVQGAIFNREFDFYG